MTDFIDRLSNELVRVAQLDVTPAHSGGVRRHRMLTLVRRKPTVLVIGLLAVVAAPALAVTQPWNPAPRQIVAQKGATAAGHVPTGRVSITTQAPSAEQVSRLGILRRPARAIDHSPEVARALRQLYGGFTGVEINYVRVLHHASGEPLVLLVPAKSWSSPPGPTRQPSESVTNPLCVVVVPPSGIGSSGGCQPTSVLTSGHLLGSYGSFEYGVVPDGVASVVLHFPDGTSHKVPVQENSVALTGPAAAQRSGPPQLPRSVQWLDSSGAPVPQTG